MPDLLCLGEPLIEFNRQADGRYLQGFGGDTSNCAIAAARQGARVGYVTRLGRDALGGLFRELWRREGVDAACVAEGDGHTGVYFVAHGPEGHEFSYLRAGSAASRMAPQDLPRDALRAAKILHVSGISQAISDSAADAVFAAMAEVRAAGGRVSYDTNLRLKLWPLERARAIIHAAVALADIALPGLEDARALTGLQAPEAVVDFYLRLGPGVVVLTLGAEGALVATPERREHLPAPQVAAVDATGAGDTFDGAFLAELLAGRDVFAAGRYAVAAAALSTRGYGAVAPMPRRAEVAAFLQAGDAG